jgi:hypothetical protein
VESNWAHSTLWPPIGILYQPRVIVMMEKLVEWLARKTEVLGRKPAPVPLCPPQTPHAARTRTRAAAVGSYDLLFLPLTKVCYHLSVKQRANIAAVFEYDMIRYSNLSINSCLTLYCYTLWRWQGFLCLFVYNALFGKKICLLFICLLSLISGFSAPDTNSVFSHPQLFV